MSLQRVATGTPKISSTRAARQSAPLSLLNPPPRRRQPWDLSSPNSNLVQCIRQRWCPPSRGNLFVSTPSARRQPRRRFHLFRLNASSPSSPSSPPSPTPREHGASLITYARGVMMMVTRTPPHTARVNPPHPRARRSMKTFFVNTRRTTISTAARVVST